MADEKAIESTGAVFQGQEVDTAAAAAEAAAAGGGTGTGGAVGAVTRQGEGEGAAAAPGTTGATGATATGDKGEAPDPTEFVRGGQRLGKDWVPKARLDEALAQARRAETLEQELAALKSGKGGAAGEKTGDDLDAKLEMPDRTKFEGTADELLAEVARVAAHNARVEARQGSAQTAEPTEEQKAAEAAAWGDFQTVKIPAALDKMGITMETYNARLQDVAKLNIQQTPKDQAATQGFILHYADNGPELLLAMADPAMAGYLQKAGAKTGPALVLELNRMDERVARGLNIDGSAKGGGGGAGGPAKGGGGGEGEKGSNQPPPARQVSPPEGGAGGVDGVDPASMSMAEYKKFMDEQEVVKGKK
jgi:hypothetical protein